MSVARVEEAPDVPIERVKRRSLTIAGDASYGARKKWREWFGEESFVYPDWIERPAARGSCASGPRPCAFVSCSMHLYLDVNPATGALTLNFPDLEPDELAVTCALDLADDFGKTLEDVAAAMNLTRERIRQYEVVILRKLKAAAGGDLGLPPERSGDGAGDGWTWRRKGAP